jgi:hypothetical protein
MDKIKNEIVCSKGFSPDHGKALKGLLRKHGYNKVLKSDVN